MFKTIFCLAGNWRCLTVTRLFPLSTVILLNFSTINGRFSPLGIGIQQTIVPSRAKEERGQSIASRIPPEPNSPRYLNSHRRQPLFQREPRQERRLTRGLRTPTWKPF